MNSTLQRTGIALGLAGFTLLVHLATAGRFDVFRDELYFIVCGRHPAFGYVDQPPLIPLWAAFSQSFGENLVLLRLPSALAAAATVYVVCAFARLASGGRFAEFIAGLATAVAPMYLGRGYLLDTTILEALAWTLTAYLVARRILMDDRSAIVWLGVVVGVALEAKYSIPFYLVALAAGLAATPQRRILATREIGVATAIAALIAVPSIAWQALHGWPFVELLRNGADGKNVVVAPLAFELNQILSLNPWFAPLWIAGIVAPFRMRVLAPLRGLALAFVLVTLVMIALHAKDYYLAAAYGAMFALGAVALERLLRNALARAAYVALAVAFSAIVAPIALPVLAPDALLGYLRALHVTPAASETNQIGNPLPQTFADQFGWRELARTVALAYAKLPPGERERTAVIARNYGEAAALDVYGRELGLPPALSGHNTYFLWGTAGYDGASVLRVNGDAAYWKGIYRDVRIVATFGSPDAMAYERNRPILWCRGPRKPFSAIWSDLRTYN